MLVRSHLQTIGRRVAQVAAVTERARVPLCPEFAGPVRGPLMFVCGVPQRACGTSQLHLCALAVAGGDI